MRPALSTLTAVLYSTVVLCALGVTPDALAVYAPIQADTFVNGGAPNSIHGSDINLQVGGPNSKSTYVRFDLATVPHGTVGANVQQANLLLWVNQASSPAPTLQISRVLAPAGGAPMWSEATMNGGNPASIDGSVPPILATAPIQNQYMIVDVTAHVQWWIDHPGSNNGFVIQGTPVADVRFDSKENNGNSPLLDITLSTGAGSQGPAGAAATITVGSTVTGAPGTSASVTNVGTSSVAVLNFTIPQGPQGPKGDPGLSGSGGGLTWVAANNAVVGPERQSGYSQGAAVYTTVGGVRLTMEIIDDGLHIGPGPRINPFGGLFFGSPDCQGQMYIRDSFYRPGDQRHYGGPPLKSAASVTFDSTVIYIGQDVAARPVTLWSEAVYGDYASNPPSCLNYDSPGATFSVVPVETSVDIASQYPGPLHLQ